MDWGQWKPVRKVLAAAITAFVTASGLIAWLGATGELEWRSGVAAVAATVLPAVVAYLTGDQPLPPGGEPIS